MRLEGFMSSPGAPLTLTRLLLIACSLPAPTLPPRLASPRSLPPSLPRGARRAMIRTASALLLLLAACCLTAVAQGALTGLLWEMVLHPWGSHPGHGLAAPLAARSLLLLQAASCTRLPQRPP